MVIVMVILAMRYVDIQEEAERTERLRRGLGLEPSVAQNKSKQ